MARAKPAFPISKRIAAVLTKRHTAKMRANPDDDQPLWPFRSICIWRGIDEVSPIIGACKGNLFLRASVNENRFPLPLERDARANLNAVKINLDRGQCGHIRTWVHRIDQRPNSRSGRDYTCTSGAIVKKVTPCRFCAGVANTVVSCFGGILVDHIKLQNLIFCRAPCLRCPRRSWALGPSEPTLRQDRQSLPARSLRHLLRRWN